MDERVVRPAGAWLGHPVTLMALAVLLLNDRVLKPTYGTWWTGKLSDVAGLVLAPALLAVVLALVAPRRSPRALVVASAATVGAGFVAVKATSVGAAAAGAALTAVAGPSHVTADATDLLALPALALAGWAARDAFRRARRAPGRAVEVLRWSVVLPVAVLATAATSQVPPDVPTRVAAVDGVLYVGVGSVGSEHARAWHRTSDAATWESSWSGEDLHDEWEALVADAGGPTTVACEPAHPRTCYRAGEDGLLVERSTDGGATWATDWTIPPDVAAELSGRYSDTWEQLRTCGIAVLEASEGAVVYAANGGDGLAVRHADGTWERLGFPFWSDPPAVVPLPGERTAYDYAVPPWLAAATAAAGLCALVLARRAGTTEGRRNAGVALLVAGAAPWLLSVLVSAQQRAVRGQGFDGTYPVILDVAHVLGAVLFLTGAALLGAQETIGWAFLVGAAAGAGTALAGDSPLAAVVAVAAALGLAVLVRRPVVGAGPADEPAVE